MYAVVGCNDCHALWLLEDPDAAETATCPRCQRRHRTAKLKRLFTADDRDTAREARAAMLADAADATDAFDSTPSVAEMEVDTDAAVVDDDEYLDAAGIDADEVAAAGERSTAGRGSRSRPDIVRDALRTLDAPDEDDVVAYASEHGVPEDAAVDLLDRLVRRGEVTEHGGTYRLL
ncbi:DUF5817 domain-containing protein [Haloplanus aerogenes]|uniref:Replication protein H n=1 Tax=Haloplanus aerogenes TaxID=660522 RepID=A0A3M0DQ66_9EURY|nr:DUF5817 domain-containing protein [Haloplanus aerogenes]AZH24436.1 replication protein H [Haloplanus aerogenes]RMB23918.1 hypothetical protein ATH50_1148 [Haloplanus aerogenes]